jgi:diguanylate cyclase (GGDEF)-like protein
MTFTPTGDATPASAGWPGSALEDLPIAVLQLDHRGRPLRGNAALAALLGLPARPLSGTELRQLTGVPGRCWDVLRHVLTGATRGVLDEVVRVPNGPGSGRPDPDVTCWRVRSQAMQADQEGPQGSLVLVEPQPIGRAAVGAAAPVPVSDGDGPALEAALEAAGGGFAVFEADDTDGGPRLRLVYGNAAAQTAFGVVSGERLGPCLPPRPSPQIWGQIWNVLLGEQVDGRDQRMDGVRGPDTADGVWDVTIAPAGPRRAVVSWRDATGAVRDGRGLDAALGSVEVAATRDPLTGLPNRVLLRHRLADALAHCLPGQRVGILFCTLDGLADEVGRRHGAVVGDALLQVTAGRLRGLLAGGDLAARLGGDTFAVVLAERSSQEDVEAISHRYLARLGRPVAAHATVMAPSPSIGLVMVDPIGGPDADRDPNTVLLRGYEAMQRSRSTRRAVVTEETPTEAEHGRVAALAGYDVHDGALDAVFRSFAQIAGTACAARYALISFVDADLEWVRASHGYDPAPASDASAPRHLAWSDATIRGRTVLEKHDRAADPRWWTRHVEWQFGMAFYAGAPLITPEGRAIGVVAVLDDEPRPLSARQRRTLVTLADELMGLLEVHRLRKR